jgi:hypothetical protein
MAKKAPELMSKNGYAKYLGVNEKAIRNAVADGKIKKGWDAVNQKIIKHLADKEYGFLHTSPKAGPGISAAKLIEKLSPKKEPDKVSKVRTKSSISSDENLESPKSEVEPSLAEILNPKQIGDLSKMDTSELLQLITITADMDYKEAMTTGLIIEAALKKKKLEELEDVLVRRQTVENSLYAFGAAFKKDLMAIATRVVDDIMIATNKVEGMNILNKELNSVLEKHSMQNITLTNKN